MRQREQALEYKEKFLESSYQEEKNLLGYFQCSFLRYITLQHTNETMRH